MYLTVADSRADVLNDTILANQVLWLCLQFVCIIHFLFTVDQAAEVGLLTLVTQVESASIVCELLLLSVVNVTSCLKPWVVKNTLYSRVL